MKPLDNKSKKEGKPLSSVCSQGKPTFFETLSPQLSFCLTINSTN